AHTGQIRKIVNVSPTIGTPPETDLTLRLLPPRPNPSGADVTFQWTLPRAGPVTLTLFDPAGRRVQARSFPAGTTAWTGDGNDQDGRPVRPGLLLARLEFEGTSIEHRIVRLR